MPTMSRNSKGHFVKRSKSSRRRRSASRALVRQSTRTVYRTRSARRVRRRRGGSRSGGGMGINLLHVGLAAGALAYATGDSGPAMIRNAAAKIPGTKTFGAAATIGLGCLAVDRFVKRNRYLKLLGVAGVVLAATQVGRQGTGFRWVGDDDLSDVADMDMSDVEDVGEYE